MMNKEEKIGMYTSNEIYEELANGFLQRSMVDAMYFKIKDLQQRIDKAKDKLYCWGEVLDPNFQKEMLEILGDKNE